jgi:N6-L-threonylcarbamoyladenine synthase
MLILGIETSCDETSVAIIKAKVNSPKVSLLSNIIATSLQIHSKTGGIIPENAAREQIKFIIPVIKEALNKANVQMKDIDKIAVTYGPGLIGSLLIGVETAKTLSFIYKKPLIPTNHLLGHIYANFIEPTPTTYPLQPNINFPAIGLIVSGGHTDLLLMKNHKDIIWLGGTRDDAAGEALDKIGRLLKLPYPGGLYIEQAAKKGDPKKYTFPKPLIGSDDFDFSFSGLKTAVFRDVQKMRKLDDEEVNNICASVQKTIIDILVRKTIKAAEKYNAKSILIGGGVAANQALKNDLQLKIKNSKLKIALFVPERRLCTDNAAMICSAAYFNQKEKSWKTVDANPNLYF